MKITFLGTGAADWPTKKTEETSEFRRNSSLLIDDILLIDPGAQVPDALKEYRKDAKNIKYIINTHRHVDHFSPETVAHLESLGARLVPLKADEQIDIGRYTVMAYAANHPTCENTVHFIITDGEKTLFYGLDGAWLLMDEVKAIQKHRPDLAIFDATIGDVEGDYRIFEHNDLNMVLEMKKTLESYIGSFYISHMARTLHTDHKTLSEKMKLCEVQVAYDGLEINI